jgi:hypothetical protein
MVGRSEGQPQRIHSWCRDWAVRDCETTLVAERVVLPAIRCEVRRGPDIEIIVPEREPDDLVRFSGVPSIAKTLLISCAECPARRS